MSKREHGSSPRARGVGDHASEPKKTREADEEEARRGDEEGAQEELSDEVSSRLVEVNRAWKVRKKAALIVVIVLGLVITGVLWATLLDRRWFKELLFVNGVFAAGVALEAALVVYHLLRLLLIRPAIIRLMLERFPLGDPATRLAVAEYAPDEGKGYGSPIQMALREIRAKTHAHKKRSAR